jgi:hypothetical protein
VVRVWLWGCRPLLLAGTVQAEASSRKQNCYIYPTRHGSRCCSQATSIPTRS